MRKRGDFSGALGMNVWVGWDWLKAQWGVGWDSNTQGLSTVIGEKTMCGHACRWEGRCAGEPVFMQVLFWLFLFFHWSRKEGHKLRVRIGKEMLKVWEKERYEMLLWRYGEVNGQGSTISLQGSTKNPLEWSGIYSEKSSLYLHVFLQPQSAGMQAYRRHGVAYDHDGWDLPGEDSEAREDQGR